MNRSFRNRSGFSTVIAILLTAFLTVLSAGVLNLFLAESRINHFLFDGIATYMWAEWSLEYALLKIRNHREGFADGIEKSDAESGILTSASSSRKPTASYGIENSGKSYSGVLAKGVFEIIPLFYDEGVLIQEHAKHPNIETSNLKKTADFSVKVDGDMVWNIIGNDTSGKTFGLVGSGSVGQTFGNAPSALLKEWFEKYQSDDRMNARTRAIGDFLSMYENVYLILYSASNTPVHYSIESSNGFSYPSTSVIASSSIGKSKQNIEFKESQSELFDILKYSLFNK